MLGTGTESTEVMSGKGVQDGDPWQQQAGWESTTSP